ncbi:MAG TPA: phosphotransferase [Candidatus Dormibacteraeota bacterium]|nr:phosphotransferase [Candidatus Dormibacteraeota bacterium]
MNLRLPPPGLDPALGDLGTALAPAAAARGFERRLRVPVSGCELAHVRWSPGRVCEAVYRIGVAGPAAATAGVVLVRAEGVEHRILADDPDLPGLGAATDAVRMSGWLSARLGRRVEVRGITPVSYRPGSRCMLRYELGGTRPAHVYGKVLAPEGHTSLAAAVTALGGVLTPPLVGVAAEWGLVVQEDAGGPALRSLAVDPLPERAPELLGAGGRLLARLHAHPGAAGPARTLAADALALREHLTVMERVVPATAERFAAAASRLAAADDEEGPAVPGHGALRLDQIHLTSAGGPVFIDLDSFCTAEPARDLGNLLAYLWWREIRLPAMAPATAAVRAAVLDGYAREAGAAVDPARIALHQAAAALKIAGRCLQKLAVSEWEHVPLLVAAALDELGAPAGGVR